MATESGVDNANKKKPNIFVRIGRWFKSAALELRKTTWPKAGEVFKKLGTVFIVVLFFFLILMLMDWLLGLGYRELTSGLQSFQMLAASPASYSGPGASMILQAPRGLG